MNNFTFEIAEKVTIFEKLMTEFAKDNEVEINRLMLIVSDSIKDDIKNGKFDFLKTMTVEEIKESLNKIKDEKNTVGV